MNKGVRGILLLAGLLMAAPAVAGTVYRCQGTDGALSYSSARVSGARCTAVSSYGSRPSRSPVASVASGKTVASAAATPAASKPKAAEGGGPKAGKATESKAKAEKPAAGTKPAAKKSSPKADQE